jgi:hypothetical protein
MTVTLCDKRGKQPPSSFFYKGCNVIQKGRALMTCSPPKGSFLNAVILGIKFNMNLGHTGIQMVVQVMQHDRQNESGDGTREGDFLASLHRTFPLASPGVCS